MKGKIIAVNISKDKGEKKQDVGRCLLVEDHGLEHDAHAGPWHRQVSLLAEESIDKMRAMGLKVGPGDFAENLTVTGIDLPALPIGTTLRVGVGVILQVTQIGKVCHDRCNIFKTVGDCVMPREGIFAQVMTGGEVAAGDDIEVVRS